ncbi:helix-turn-helix domain-containing protein [Nocardia niwae]|uniref:Helix-turn-helix domain-containing protein n=1 Tax=Nocardia niwae TaxID=626084 RepID=A0ABV2X5E4_9NOCA
MLRSRTAAARTLAVHRSRTPASTSLWPARSPRGRALKLSKARQVHLLELHAAGEHTIAELAELFEVSRPTVYRVLDRAGITAATADAA